VAVLAYALRVIGRLPCLGGVWGLDDWVMTVAMVRLTSNPTLPLPVYYDLQIAGTGHSAYSLRGTL
jgi:hypothetical protein